MKQGRKSTKISHLPTRQATGEMRSSQLAWSLFVAITVAAVALQQAMAHRELPSSAESALALPQALMSGQPLPYSSRDNTLSLHWSSANASGLSSANASGLSSANASGLTN